MLFALLLRRVAVLVKLNLFKVLRTTEIGIKMAISC